MTDGLKSKQRETIIKTLSANPKVERIVLFGSRAMGTFTPTSDIDIALFGDDLTLSDQAALAEEMAELPIPQRVDILIYNRIENQALREHICKHGVEWFARRRGVSQSSTKGGEWTELPFSEAVLLNPPVRLERGRRYPFVDMGAVSAGSRCAYATEEREFFGGGSRFLHGDTLMARITPCLENGKIARFCALHGSVLGHGSTEFIVVRGRHRITETAYAYYLTKWEEVRDYAISQMTGTSGRQRVPIDSFDHLVVPIPPLPEQRAIAHILGTLDDKIELNRKQNETLEAMARALFKSWFIDFDPVRRNAARARNQPSPQPSPSGRGSRNYRGGYDFSGLARTARELRRKQTPTEELFWELVRDRRFLGLKFRRQHQLGDYIADFYCHQHRLVIELDGGVHSARQKKDHKRDAWMKAQGLTVLRFPNEQLLDDPEAVLSHIAKAVFPSPLVRRAGDEGVIESTAFPLPLGEGQGERSVEELDRLFPDRFVESELGEIPEGWGVGCVDDEFDLTMGQSPPGDTYNEAGEGLPFYQGRADFGFRFPTRRVYCTAPTRLAKTGDTLISVRAPVGDINMASEDCAIGRGVAAARHKTGSRSYSYQFMCSLKEVFARFEAEGTVFGSIRKKDFHAIRCVMPPYDLVMEFERCISPLDSRIAVNELESRTLAALRDALLPKLISGEIRVKDAERFLKERGL